MELVFNVSTGSKSIEISQCALNKYATQYGLDSIAKGRYSSLFVLNLMLAERISGVNPFQVIDEIQYLEGIKTVSMTKPETEFRRKPLKGLWHKHFFSSHISTFAHNISNHLGNGRLNKLVDEVFDPKKSEVVTKEMIGELSHRIVIDSFEGRASQHRLTGEWIIFAKENGENYYLGIWTHRAEDDVIANSISAACTQEFPFLEKYFS